MQKIPSNYVCSVAMCNLIPHVPHSPVRPTMPPDLGNHTTKASQGHAPRQSHLATGIPSQSVPCSSLSFPLAPHRESVGEKESSKSQSPFWGDACVPIYPPHLHMYKFLIVVCMEPQCKAEQARLPFNLEQVLLACLLA
jgi:hypothetical protein